MKVGVSLFMQNYTDWLRYEGIERGDAVTPIAIPDSQIYEEDLRLGKLVEQCADAPKVAVAGLRQHDAARHAREEVVGTPIDDVPAWLVLVVVEGGVAPCVVWHDRFLVLFTGLRG